MFYTIKIEEDHTVNHVQRTRIMQRSKLVDALRILVPKTYNGVNMNEFQLVLEYKLPISHDVKSVRLDIDNKDYKDDFLLYTLPFDTNITAENGDVELHFFMCGNFMDVDGKVQIRDREIATTSITITPITSWFVATDDVLTDIAQMYTAGQQQFKALTDLVNILNQQKADDIKLDVQNGQIYAVSNGQKIGTGITTEELANELVEASGNSEGNVKITNR